MESHDPTLVLAPVAQIIFPKKITITFTGLVELGTLGPIPKQKQKVIFEAPTTSQHFASVFDGSDNESHEETQNQPPQASLTAIAMGTEDMRNGIVVHDPLPLLASSHK
jgi:hypothetical protein